MKPFPFLETFLEAAERGTFTAAGRALGLTQAAVSQRIHQLETALNTSLFRRQPGKVVLTDAGRTLYEYARRIQDLTAEAWAALTGTPGEARGELVLAASSVPGQYLLPTTLAAYRKQHPRVEVRVSVTDTDDVLRLVERGDAHLGLVGGQGGGSRLEFRKFAGDQLVLVVPAGHRWRRRRKVTVREFLAQPLIQRERGSGSRRCLERGLEGVGVTASSLNVVLELGSTEAIKEAVLRGVGLAILSRRAIEKEVRAGDLRAVEVDGLTLDRDIYLVRDRRRALPEPANLFLALVDREAGLPS
ncbi:MAG TPA: selenium metabolism-associated LysR family transcriptional regulator [Gemmataceae bacterium]|jgi:DNA-binding transcriptional LysR family regulator|nr:selenium metabolism-associated LysR family transcriptional regulator [Gemmataceae bacterium]